MRKIKKINKKNVTNIYKVTGNIISGSTLNATQKFSTGKIFNRREDGMIKITKLNKKKKPE
jgi:hypothetical protein